MFSKTIVPIISALLLVSTASTASTTSNESLQISSSAFVNGGTLPVQFSCEGEGITPPLNWTGVPDGTKSLVMIMDHKPAPRPAGQQGDMPPPPPASEDATAPKPKNPDELRWYWTVYNISAATTAISNEQTVGTLGGNVVNERSEYAPPCSKGPGLKNYTFHLYALSTTLNMSQADIVSEATLRTSMRGSILDSDSLTVSFERSCRLPPKQASSGQSDPKQAPPKPRPPQGSEQDAKRAPPPVLPLCAVTE